MAPSIFAYLSVLVIAVVLFSRFKTRGRLPDGPRGVPFFGFIPDKNIKLYQQLASLIPKYGDFFSLSMGGSDMIVLSSPAVIDELVNKRGGKYSSRPASSAQAKILGQGRILSLQYGDEFKVRTIYSLSIFPSSS
jgi:26-hydroxylase